MPLTIIGSRFYMSRSPRDFYVGLCFDRPSNDGLPHGEPTAGDYARELTHFIYSDASAELANSEAVRFHALTDWGVMSYVVVSQVPSGEVFSYQVIPPKVMSAGTVLEIDVGDLILASGAYVAAASVAPGDHYHTWAEVTGKPSVFPPQAEMLSLNQLVDVATTGVTDGQVLGFNAGVWGPITGGGGGDHPDADHTTFHPLGGTGALDITANDASFNGHLDVLDFSHFYNPLQVHDRAIAHRWILDDLGGDDGYTWDLYPNFPTAAALNFRSTQVVGGVGGSVTQRAYLTVAGLFVSKTLQAETVTLTTGGATETTDTRYARTVHTHPTEWTVAWPTGSEPSLSGIEDGTVWIEYTP